MLIICQRPMVFSSSATAYGDPVIIPITEEHPKGTSTNRYGWTKSILEQIFGDIKEHPGLKVYNLGTKIDVPEISRPAMRMQIRQRKDSAGRLSTESKRCVRIPGDGRARIRMDILMNEKV